VERVGRGDGVFPSTEWTQIEGMGRAQLEQQQALIGMLLGRYWKPVSVWLCRQGYPPDVAEDYTQGFFCDIVLERDLIKRADRTRGRFRTFLLTALKGFVSDTYRKEHALKRSPRGGSVSIDRDQLALEGPALGSPDAAFDFMWASNVLDQVIGQLEREYQAKGMEKHWSVFSAKVLRPIMEGSDEPSYESICHDLGVADLHKAAAMTTSVKRRFRTLLRQTVRPLVERDPQVEDEISELLVILSRPQA